MCGFVIRQEKSSKQILREVSGIARPGEVLAIMGASGAGKSTLLNTLLFRNSGGLDISGTRIADGEVAGRIFSNKIPDSIDYQSSKPIFISIFILCCKIFTPVRSCPQPT